MKKQMLFKTKGMNRDLSVSAFNPEFSFENMNLRLSTNDGNTQLSWTNEKGTASIQIVEEDTDGIATTTIMNISGVPVGTATINHYLILFTKATDYDYIYRLKYTDSAKTKLQCKILCKSVSAYMDLSTDNPLETLVSYESDNVQKVYWVDGKNQPRVINICNTYGVITSAGYCKFDFVQELQLNEEVSVQKQLGGGMFAPGVIQYAFTYFDKYGPETNIFYTTPLQYISYKERGASPEDKVENSFKITVKGVDEHFKYLRIYSIQRTSINATPICKRIQDIEITGLSPVSQSDSRLVASYIDTGTSGDSIDPTELLYKGGEPIVAETLEQKDNTLFFGRLSTSREQIKDGMDINGEIVNLKSDIKASDIGTSVRQIQPIEISSSPYRYYNQLTSNPIVGNTPDKSRHVPCGGFKTGNKYRLGVQFQHKSGKWSDPIYIKDEEQNKSFNEDISLYVGRITIPVFTGAIKNSTVSVLKTLGYKKVRACIAVPRLVDRNIICQGVAAPTVYTNNHRGPVSTYEEASADLYAQSSWFFRPYINDASQGKDDIIYTPKSQGYLRYTQRNIKNGFPESDVSIFSPDYMRQVEIEGDYVDNNKFKVDREFISFHSPDLEFDDQLALLDFTDSSYGKVGTINFNWTLSDIDIQTETPTVSNSGSGFVHKSFKDNSARGIIAGLFYDDYVVDDDLDPGSRIGAYPDAKQSAKWLVYPWHGTGSLNNDINRPADKGVGTAKLKKKVISNLRYASTSINQNREGDPVSFSTISPSPQLFNSDQNTIIKVGDKIYKGNIDTSLLPDNPDGSYFCWDGYDIKSQTTISGEDYYQEFPDKKTKFSSDAWTKVFSLDPNNKNEQGIRKWKNNSWLYVSGHIGDDFVDLAIKKHPVRMKYKSTPHLVFGVSSLGEDNNQLSVIEIKQQTNDSTRYGGKSVDALKENIWIPCGEPVSLDNVAQDSKVHFEYSYGDTYFQRYDCLKTYPFTREDINQIVEIGSFMLETYVNIEGRYDRNRGQSNNLNMTPQNFNLLNPIYSQLDNFFSYKIMDDSYYENTKYPNQITWSKTKENGADVDMWTNVTLASILELDGDKGSVSKLIRMNDQLLCFQDTGISQILYNDNVQISSTEGVPIEIANSGKVQGKRYLSNTIGCSNKWSLVQTPAGIYFMDSNDKSIYRLGEGLVNVSQQGGMNSWCKGNIPDSSHKWTPDEFDNFRSYYDKKNQDILFVNKDIALAYSEKFGVFTSFYNYGGGSAFANLNDTGVWITKNLTHQTYGLWQQNSGAYCKFFDNNYPYWMTLVGNPEPQADKIFTNLEFRANSDMQNPGDSSSVPFDNLETWNEYQHGIAEINLRNGHSAMVHHRTDSNEASLKRKFRIWRCDIPRDNAEFNFNEDAKMGIFRTGRHPQDRMRNPWLYIKLYKASAGYRDTLRRTEIHDVVMTYFD